MSDASQVILAGFVGGFASAMTTSFFAWWRKQKERQR
jgi:hypothetical protein